MREFVNELSDAERLVLAEISANPVLKKLIGIAVEDLKLSITQFNPDEENFKANYRSAQFILGVYVGWIEMLDDLFDEFYKPRQMVQPNNEGQGVVQ